MAEKIFINTIKTQTHRFWTVFLQKTQHLLQELSDDPKGGFIWWLKTHSQKLALDKALEELLQEARKPDFQLDKVSQVFAKFKLKADDAGQVQWYQDAHDQLINCQQQLENASTLKPKMIKPALTELRFISEADQFHQHFQLQPLQRRVRDMYEAITERLDILVQDTKNKNQQHQQELEVRKKEAEVQHAAELARQQEYQLQQEQAEVKKLETERDLIDHRRDADEEAWKREEADRQLQIQESQYKHHQDLQDTFTGLQLDGGGEKPHIKASIGNDGMIGITADQHINALLRQIENSEVDPSKPQVKKQLDKLLIALQNV